MRFVLRAMESVWSRALKVRLWGVYDALRPDWDDRRLLAEELAFDEHERADYRLGIALVRGVHR